MKLTILGTASQLPTRDRNQNAYFLEGFQGGILFDPGEGTQRQFTLAGISPGNIHRIFLSHFHGDHCLGLPGIMQRLSLMEVPQTVKIYYPREGEPYMDALSRSSAYTRRIDFEFHPLEPGVVEDSDDHRIEAFRLEHSTPVLGYRFTKRSRLRFRQELLDAHELYGPLVGQLETDGSIMHKGELISREELSYRTKEKIFAYVLDTGICNAIPELIRDADAVLMEGTYLNTEQELADRYGHMTAEAAARYARDHHVGKLILTHYSERYKDLNLYEKAVEKLFKNTHIAKDFDVIAI